MSKVYLPNELVRKYKNGFIVPRKMTKREVKEYFEKVYEVSVGKVRTIQMDGKIKRSRGRFPYQKNRYKKALCLFIEEK